jgi:hypothetical protein
MSLYHLQKMMYRVNRESAVKTAFLQDPEALLDQYRLSPDERRAIREDDIGRLYVMGVNGQILMHYAAWRGFEWDRYVRAMRDGLERHGPVHTGVYAAVDAGRGGAL